MFVNCTVRTSREYVRRNTIFTLIKNGNASKAGYEDTRDWDENHGNTTVYVRQQQIVEYIYPHSSLQCSLQDPVNLCHIVGSNITFLPHLSPYPQTGVSGAILVLITSLPVSLVVVVSSLFGLLAILYKHKPEFRRRMRWLFCQRSEDASGRGSESFQGMEIV